MIAAAALLLAAVSDPRAADAIRLFASLCASSRGSRGVAMARLGDGQGMGRRLSDRETRQLHGTAGGMGWALTSPAGAVLTLDFPPGGGTCAVRVVDADDGALRSGFAEAAALLATGFGGTLSTPVERDGTLAYDYAANGRPVRIALTTLMRPIDGHRHRMTFAFTD